MSQFLLVEECGGVGLITLSRPKAMNALSLGMVHRTEKGPMLKFSVSGGLNAGGQTPTVGMGAGWSW